MMSTKQVVLALLVSAQIASAADVSPANVGYIDSFKNICSSFSSSSSAVASLCLTEICAHKKPIIAVAAVSAVSVAAYYNWDRVQNAYNRAVAYVKENQETIVANAKIGGAVLGATSVVVGAAYVIKSYFFGDKQEVTTEQVEQKEEQEKDSKNEDIKSEEVKKEEVTSTPAEEVEKKK